MFLSLLNLCYGDCEKVLLKKIPRAFCHIASKVDAVTLKAFTIDSSDEVFYIVHIHVTSAPDPKVHFSDQVTAEKFCSLILEGIVNNTPFLQLDVLEHGAI